MKEISEKNFAEEVEQYSGCVVVKCWAEWCGPCKRFAPIVQEVADELSQQNVKFVGLNIDDATNIASKLSVRSIPTIFLFKNGVQVDVKVGSVNKDALKEWITAHI
ncbi:MAG: thioredoxin [Proteobacteria bacterium]|nr:thioredoxin [Pseudomonadota bacterium]